MGAAGAGRAGVDVPLDVEADLGRLLAGDGEQVVLYAVRGTGGADVGLAGGSDAGALDAHEVGVERAADDLVLDVGVAEVADRRRGSDRGVPPQERPEASVERAGEDARRDADVLGEADLAVGLSDLLITVVARPPAARSCTLSALC
jgi:hypothetical protein